MPNAQPVVVDLEMSDVEYLQCLAQGIDPVKQYRDISYERVLIRYGISPTQARQIAPLLEKLDCSIEEKIQVNQVLKHIWHQLTGGITG